MPNATAAKTSWDHRIERAVELGGRFPFAAQVLAFYVELARFQKAVYQGLHSCSYAASGDPARLPAELDTFIVLPKISSLLDLVSQTGPTSLTTAAREIEQQGPDEWSSLLRNFWSADGEPLSEAETFFATALLQPLAEHLAEQGEFDRSDNYGGLVCPFCNRKPVAGVLRPEGDGGKRSLICSLCATEWQFRRICCAGCGENDLEKLPVFISEEFPHVRIECCRTCERFIKTSDMTKQGHADPLVDELASVPVTLWAEQQGYSKLQRNLLAM